MVKDEKRHIKRSWFLTHNHVYPKKFQTMNVKLSFQVGLTITISQYWIKLEFVYQLLFSSSSSAEKSQKTMKYYGDKGANGFKGCEATVEFI